MKLISALFAMALLLAGCSGSSDDASPASTTATPTDASRLLDRDQLEQQAQEQAEQQQAASDELEKATAEQARGTVTIVIKDGKVTPQGDRVEVAVGQKITLKVTSDVDEEIHVHSEPEHSYEVPAGGSIEKSFTVDTPGQVAVEAHGLDVTIVQLVVRP